MGSTSLTVSLNATFHSLLEYLSPQGREIDGDILNGRLAMCAALTSHLAMFGIQAPFQKALGITNAIRHTNNIRQSCLAGWGSCTKGSPLQ